MNPAKPSGQRSSACRLVFLTAAMAVLSGGPTALGENAAAAVPRDGKGFPWPFVLQLQHDRPLVVEGRVLDAAGKPLDQAEVSLIAVLADNSLLVVRPQLLGEVASTKRFFVELALT
jgi:hypothetical protein